MPGSQKAGKSKRPRNEKAKLIGSRCFARAEQRHSHNGKTQAARHIRNLQNGFTPWQQACAERKARRLMTCAKCRVLFEKDGEPSADGKCPQCEGTTNLKLAWEKR